VGSPQLACTSQGAWPSQSSAQASPGAPPRHVVSATTASPHVRSRSARPAAQGMWVHDGLGWALAARSVTRLVRECSTT
jgi:hypothetical protein